MNYMQGDGRGLGGGPPPPRPTSGYIQHQHLQGHQHHQQPHLGGMQGPHHGQQQHPALQQHHHAYQQQQAQHQPQPPAQHHPPLPSTASSMSHHHGMGSNGGMGNNLMGSNGGLGIGSSLDDDQLFKQFLKQDTGVVDLEYDGDDAFQKMEEELMNNDYLFDAPIMQMPPAGADALSNPPSAPLSSGRSNGQQQTGSGTYHNQGEMYPPASRNKGFDASNSTSSGPSSAWGTASNETSTTSTTATSSTSPSTTSTSTTSTSPSSTSTTTTGSPPSSSQQQPAGQGAGGSRFQRNGPAKSEDDQQDQDFSMGMAQGSDGAGPQGSKQQPGPSGATNASGASAGGSVPSSGPPSGNAPQLGSSASMGQPAAGQQQQQPPAQGAGGGVQSQLQQQQQIHLQQQQQLHQQQIQQQQQLQQHQQQQQQQQQQQHPRDLQQLQQHHQQQQQQLQQQHHHQQQQLHQHQFQQHQQQLHHMQQQQQRHQAAAAGRSAATAPSPPSISSTPSSGPTPPAPAQPTPPAQSTSMGPGGPGGGGMMLPGQQMGKWKGAAHHQQAPPTAGPGSNGAPVGGIPSSGPIGGLPPQPQQQPGPAGGLIRSTSYDAVAGQMKMGGGGMDPRMVGAQGQVHPGMQRNPYHAYGAYGPPQGQQHGAPPHLQQQSQPPQPSGFAPHMQPPPGMTHGAVSGQPPNAYFAMQRNPTRTMSSPHMSLGGPGQPQPPQPTGYGGQFHPGQAAQPGGPMYEGGPHPSSGYPSSAYYGRSGGGEPVARNGEGGAAPVFSPQTQFQMQVRSQHMRRLNQALGQQATPGGPVAGGPTGPAPSPGGQSGPAMVTTPGGPLAASSMPSPAGPGQVGADAVGQQQLSHVTTPGGTQSAGGGVPSSATTVSGPVGGLPPQASAPGGVGHPGMGGYPGHPGMMAKRPPGGMGMIGGPQHPGGPQTALVSGQGQQQPGGQGQPDNNVGPGAMVGVPGGPGGPGVMPPNVGVPRSDLALSQFKEVWENLGMYRNFLFQLVPINPSALLEANVKYILATPEGAAIRTPLSLSVYVVMALGSLLRANFRMTREFANKAHEHLVHTLEQRQSIDYTLGQALLGMAYIEAAMETVPSSSKWKQFYAELAMKICKRLGAYSSILYFHSMFFISCDPTISLERLIQMQREGNQTPDLPYHTFIEPNSDGIRQAMPVSVLSHGRGNAAGRVLINVINGLNIHMKSSQLEHSQHAAAQQPGGGGPPPPYGPPMGAPPPHHGAPPPLSPAPGGSGAAATIPTSPAPTGPSPSPLTKPMSPASHFGSWTAGPTAMSMPVGSTGPVTPASAAAMGGPGGPGPGGVVPGGVVVGITGQTPQPPTMPPYFDSTSYFYQLMESMDKLEKELRVIQTTADPLPTYAYFTFCLCIYSLHAACCWRMGMKDKALFWAKKFLSDSHKEEWRSCCGGPPMQEMIGLVLNIFLQMNELESLDFQLNQIERLLVVYPALNAMVTHFQKVLWEKKEQQLIMQKRRQMYIQQQQQQGGMPGPMSPHHPLASPPPPMAMGMGMPMHPSAGVVVPHGPMPHHMGGHHLPGQGQPLPSHVPQMSPHQPQMSPQQQQQQQMAAQMTPPQPQAQEGASTGEMSPPGAKGKGGRGGRANRGRVGASAAAATKSRSGSSSGVGTPGQTSTSGDGTPSNQTPNQPSPISTTTPTTVVPQPSPSGGGAPARGRAAKQQQQQGARGAGGGKQATRSKKRERDERDETENGGGGGGGGVNGERGGIKLEEQTEERERKREREDNDSNLMRETATSSAPDSLQLAINSSSQASQDDDGSTSAGAGIKSEQSVKLERMDEQQLNGNGSMTNAGGLLGAMMGLDNGGMGLGMGSMGDVAGFGGGGPLMPPFSNGSFDAASLSLSLEDPFLEPELESGWWENL